MTIDEYKAQYPRDEVFMQIDNDQRVMTLEEYEIWVIRCVDAINNPTGP